MVRMSGGQCRLRVGVAQMQAIERDLEASLGKARALVQRAAAQGVDLVVLPEFFSREYFCQYRDQKYFSYAEDVQQGRTFASVTEWAAEFGVHIAAGVYEKADRGLYYDTIVFTNRDGEIIGRYSKAHPAAVRSLEKLYYRGGTDFSPVEMMGWRVGTNVCYDLWFPEAMRCATLLGADLVIVPYASWHEHLWDEVIRTRAFENGVFVAVCNKVGREGDWDFGGHSMICDPEGNVLVECSGTNDDLGIADLDLAAIDRARITYPMMRDRRPELYGALSTMKGYC